ncbi:MAG: MoaD/ThiS family protein [Flavobacteriales bacterium]|nr:MAG: MoaD/ThiS family protein [Flavobacteriales bacterium]
MKVLLFGMIAEKAGAEALECSAPDSATLKNVLEERIDGLSAMSYAIAIDRVIVHDNRELAGNEEVAVLPPFAGG